MSKKGITGHDEWVVTEALATALVALEQLPPKHQPRPHMDDLRKLLAAAPDQVRRRLARENALAPDAAHPGADIDRGPWLAARAAAVEAGGDVRPSRKAGASRSNDHSAMNDVVLVPES